MDAFFQFNDWLNDIVWGPPMLFLIVGTGILYTFRTGFFQVSKFGFWWKQTFGKIIGGQSRGKGNDENISPFQALTTAMASTVGTGNIVGVATAISIGGPGAVFWMWVSGFFGMMTKYAEIVLAVKFRQTDAKGAYHGGPMYYITNGMGKNWKWLAVLFAIFGTLATFGIGNMTQANSISGSMENVFGLSPLITGIILSILVGLVIIGGIKRIGAVTEKLIPFMAVFYILGSIVVLIINARNLPSAFGAIFTGAFSMEYNAAIGGLMGYTIMRAMRRGIARGVFSNEAGLGSAPIAHAASRNEDPADQGLLGVFEVFVDTLIICTMSGLVILSSGLYETGERGLALVMSSFRFALGDLGAGFVAFAILFFAGSTIIGWSYYGMQCLGFLTNNNKGVEMGYKIIFTLFVIVGATGGLEMVWDIADTLNGLMAIPNLIALVVLIKIVLALNKEYTERYGKRNT